MLVEVEQLLEAKEHPAKALSHATEAPAPVVITPPVRKLSTLSQVQCVEMEGCGPQSAQSVPRGQTKDLFPSARILAVDPPSSHSPSFANVHVLEHAWPETIATCKSMSAEKARASIFARCLIGALLAATGRNLCYGIFCITSTTNTKVPPHGAFHAAGAPSPRNTPCIKLRRARSCGLYEPERWRVVRDLHRRTCAGVVERTPGPSTRALL